MTKKEAMQVLAILKAAYPNSYKGMTKEEASGTVAVWSVQFSDVPVDIVSMAVQKLISTCKFPPAISEVKEKIEAIHWEAYELLSYCAEDRKEHYRWIYEKTRRFKNHKLAEPSICEMIITNNPELLEGVEDG